MPLPENNTPWPPRRHAVELATMDEYSAWYAGDPAELQDHYRGRTRDTGRARPAQHEAGVRGRIARWWWGTPTPAGEVDAKLHLPLAADLCGTSADLLFSEPVQLRAEKGNASLQEALEALQDAGLDAKLHETAELTAALGGGYLRIVWDEDMAPLPWPNAVHADMALPEWRWGKLAAVTFWQKLTDPHGDAVTWRLLERHEPGRIVHALFKGRGDNLGQAHPLGDHPDTEDLADLVDEDGGYSTGTDRLTAVYVPNMLPNRLHRGSNLGRSDLQGLTPMMDALDEAYSSWWRDIRHAKSRLHVPAQYLADMGPGQPGLAEVDREVYVPVQGVLGGRDNGLQIDAQQFAIRVSEHAETCKAWTERIIESAGYSTQSLSSGAGGAVTAAEVHSHERRSYMTRGKKERYWRAALVELLQTLVEVANANLSAGIREGDLSVDFQDGVQESALSLATTAAQLRNAEAASIGTRVKLVHPGWDQDAVDEEVSRIASEIGVAADSLPDPTDAGL